MFFIKAMFLIILLCNNSIVFSKENTVQSNLIETLLKTQPTYFNRILANPKKYRVQIIYTQINRDQQNRPHLTTSTYQPSKQFYYPASLVKLPIAALALEKIHQLAIPELTKETAMVTQANLS